ncbi:hypothetical protein CapIbe_014585 [Capra ibex]
MTGWHIRLIMGSVGVGPRCLLQEAERGPRFLLCCCPAIPGLAKEKLTSGNFNHFSLQSDKGEEQKRQWGNGKMERELTVQSTN